MAATLTIAVIEEDAAMRFALARSSFGAGITLEFITLADALQSEQRFSAILTDDSALLGPGERVPIVTLKEFHKCPIILMTISGNRRIEGYARQQGADVVLFKPFAMADLRRHVWKLAGISGEQNITNAEAASGTKPFVNEYTPADMGGRIAGDEAFDELFTELERRQPLQEGLDAFDVVERHLIKRALQACAGNQSHTARFLGITRNTLRKRIRKYGFASLLHGEESSDEDET